MESKVGGGDPARWRTKSRVWEGGRLRPSSGTKVSLSGRVRENSLIYGLVGLNRGVNEGVRRGEIVKGKGGIVEGRVLSWSMFHREVI
jgi:hypothetical protein